MKVYNADDLRSVYLAMDLASKFLDSLPDGCTLPEFKLVVANDTNDYTVAVIALEDDFVVADIVMEDTP